MPDPIVAIQLRRDRLSTATKELEAVLSDLETPTGMRKEVMASLSRARAALALAEKDVEQANPSTLHRLLSHAERLSW